MQNLLVSDTQEFTISRCKITLNRFGKLTIVTIEHTGGVLSTSLPVGTVNTSLRPYKDVYLGVPSLSGSPYIFIGKNGVVEIRANGGTYQPETNTTSYFLMQIYYNEL